MLIRADARHLPLVDGCVQMVVTSPPYFGLRDYGTGNWNGGSPDCDHARLGTRVSGASTLRADGREHVGPYEGERTLTVGYPYLEVCGKCGAKRVDRQLGLEASPQEYVESIVGVFAELWRVLRADGTAWLNLGDTYCNSDKWGGGGANTGKHTREPDGEPASWKAVRRRWSAVEGLKPKDLIGIPWRVALALQSAGWYLRSDIVWSKPNPMPESITDRPTKSHEYIFLLSKSERYRYDADAIKEPYAESTLREIAEGYKGEAIKDYDAAGVQNPSDTKRRIIANARKKNEASGDRRRANVNDWDKRDNDRVIAQNNLRANARAAGDTRADYNFQNGIGRNKRTVWHVPTQPYPDSHFATFPEALIEPCILAGSRPGDLVLDPFIGSGTTGAVCDRLMRRWVGTDLSYQHLAKKRTAQRGLRLELGA
jgi:DNA modification methylase